MILTNDILIIQSLDRKLLPFQPFLAALGVITNLIIEKIFAGKFLSWSGQNLKGGTPRSTDLTAIREADKGRYELLLAFARS